MNKGFFHLSNSKYAFQTLGFPGGSDSKESAGNTRDLVSIPGLGRSPEGGHDNLLQYSCLENPMGRGAWQTTVHGVEKSQSRLRHFTLYPVRSSMEKGRSDIWREIGILVTKCAIFWVGQKSSFNKRLQKNTNELFGQLDISS